jgi:hypothetical protein
MSDFTTISFFPNVKFYKHELTRDLRDKVEGKKIGFNFLFGGNPDTRINIKDIFDSYDHELSSKDYLSMGAQTMIFEHDEDTVLVYTIDSEKINFLTTYQEITGYDLRLSNIFNQTVHDFNSEFNLHEEAYCFYMKKLIPFESSNNDYENIHALEDFLDDIKSKYDSEEEYEFWTSNMVEDAIIAFETWDHTKINEAVIKTLNVAKEFLDESQYCYCIDFHENQLLMDENENILVLDILY